MDVEMNQKMDEIMELMHQITTYFIEFAKLEISGKQITEEEIENNKIIKTLFESVQKCYRELQEFIIEDANLINSYKSHEELDDDIEEEDIVKTIANNSMASVVNNLTINDLDEYLEAAYTQLNYISLYDGNGNKLVSSIYKEFERIRNREYHLQSENLEDLRTRGNIQNKSQKGRFSFTEKANIISWISRDRFFKDYAFRKIDECIIKLREKYKDNSSEESRTKINKLIEQKYILYLEYFNNRYNGLLQENDIGNLALAKDLIEQGSESLALNMTQFEIDENIKIRMEENKSIFKEIINSTLRNQSQNKKVDNKEEQVGIKRVVEGIERKVREKIAVRATEGEEK